MVLLFLKFRARVHQFFLLEKYVHGGEGDSYAQLVSADRTQRDLKYKKAQFGDVVKV